MHLAFVDDSKQTKPSREGIGAAVACGGFFLDADDARVAEAALDVLCEQTGFPEGDEFKWSPQKGSWMHSDLIEGNRERFQFGVIDVLRRHGAQAVFVAEDSTKGRASSDELDPNDDVLVMWLERLEGRLVEAEAHALLVADRPGGDTKEENRFLSDCLDQLRNGTAFVDHDRIVFIVATQGRFVRLLQAADLVASCMTAYFAGESNYAPPVAQHMLDLFKQPSGRIGGSSVKFHPDFSYLNLYYWLLGDTHAGPLLGGTPLPTEARPYAESPWKKANG